MPWLSEPASVAIFDTGRFDYPRNGPFHPAESFPEYPFGAARDPQNYIYAAVRDVLRQLGLDEANFGTAAWNPFGGIIRPGDNVIIKPNLVISSHHLGDIGLLASVAHGSVIRPLVDYALIANKGLGQITICDSPIKEVDFEKITTFNGLQSVVGFYREAKHGDVRLLDIRDLQVTRNERGVMVAKKELEGDPRGYTVVDLGPNSLLAEVGEHCTRFRSTAAVYENRMAETHNERVNLYSIPNTILQSDCVISVAKLKNHRKCGVTLSLKNKIGVTNEKRWLPHHRVGSPSTGGDICPDNAPPTRKIHEALKDNFISHSYGMLAFKYLVPVLQWVNRWFVKPWAKRLFAKRQQADFGEGDWWGNDTIWRTTLDLNMILQYADKAGVMHNSRQRQYFSVIDGILAGHKEGPLKPEPKNCGVIVGGLDPVAIDRVCTHMMGCDPEKVQLIRESHRAHYPVGNGNEGEITVTSNSARWLKWREPDLDHFGFIPSPGWRGHVERPGGRGAPLPAPVPVAAR